MEEKKIKCSKCPTKVSKLKYLKKLKDGYFCKNCIKEKRQKHREYLKRDILGIRKRTKLVKEWAEKRKNQIIKPKIKPIKQPKVKISVLGIYLTREERQVLYKKYIGLGLSPTEASSKVNNVSNKMKELVEKLRNKKKSEQEISKRFKEEFAKLISQ